MLYFCCFTGFNLKPILIESDLAKLLTYIFLEQVFNNKRLTDNIEQQPNKEDKYEYGYFKP